MDSQEPRREHSLYSVQEIKDMAHNYLHGYGEEIPEEIVRGSTRGGEPDYKIQTNWFQVVVFVLELTMEHIRFRGGVCLMK